MSVSEGLIHTTVRIACKKAKGPSFGTGFFFAFEGGEGKQIPVIVTNKHVVKGAETGHLIFSLCDEDGNIALNQRNTYEINNFEKAWIQHPDENVDLCVMPIAQFYAKYKPGPYKLHAVYVREKDIPSEEEIKEFSHIEDIVIVGYPDGLWDDKNNLPIVRRGITASSLHYDFKGAPVFIMDAAIFGGSSGSPVFLYNDGHYTSSKGLMLGSRIKLVGVNRAVYLHPVTGEITEITDTALGKTLVNIPNNLGVAIHARKLLDFKALL